MGRVLLLEDHPDWRARLAAVLRTAGHVVWEAGNREQALRRLAAKPPIELAVIDVFIEDGLAVSDELCREARELSIPVVIISGPATRAEVAGFFTRHRVVSFVEKAPFDEAFFVHQVNRALRGGRERGAARSGPPRRSSQVGVSHNTLVVIDSKIRNLNQAGQGIEVERADLGVVDYEMCRVIDRTLEEMVALIKRCHEIDAAFKVDYELEASSLHTELRKSRLNLGRIREMLAFLGDVDGTLGLTAKLSPYVAVIGPLVERLLRSTN
jgi:DNA-binding NtrC family response regulator